MKVNIDRHTLEITELEKHISTLEETKIFLMKECERLEKGWEATEEKLRELERELDRYKSKQGGSL